MPINPRSSKKFVIKWPELLPEIAGSQFYPTQFFQVVVFLAYVMKTPALKTRLFADLKTLANKVWNNRTDIVVIT
jgi:hypothetical protein